MVIVSKFGGSVTINAEGIRRAMNIVKSDPFSGTGITDLLFMCHSSFSAGENYHELLDKIADSFRAIIDGLGMSFDTGAEIFALKKDLLSGQSLDHIGSRGEYITGKILAAYLGWDFVDAAQIIFFNADGTLDKAQTFSTAHAKL